MPPSSHVPSSNQFSSIGVIGGGAWGTALASLCASNSIPTFLYARDLDQVEQINQNRENKKHLAGIKLPETLNATTDLKLTSQCEALLFMIPAQQARSVLSRMRALLGPEGDQKPIAIGAKGIERESLLLMPQVLEQVWPEANGAMLSGPSFAHDVATGKPTAVTLADENTITAARWQKTMGTLYFRPYSTDDVLGTALGGAVKNVLAIAAGIVEGMALGSSAHAALIARGFAEFNRLGLAMGASPSTLSGLSGLGDLVLTAGSKRSRNMSLGVKLGSGLSLREILACAAAVMGLADRYDVEMPVCAAVADIVEGRKNLETAITDLMSRPLKKEGL